jgi:hypothetical protein
MGAGGEETWRREGGGGGRRENEWGEGRWGCKKFAGWAPRTGCWDEGEI